MKKSLLLLVAGAMAISAGAQYARPSSMLLNPSAYMQKRVSTPTTKAGTTGRHSSGRTTSISGACVYTETFPSTVFTSGGSGGVTDIWTTGGNTGTTLGATVSGGAPWKWTNAATATMGDIGAIASTTATDGWVIFDADSIHAVSTTTAGYLPGGWIQSPVINCSALTTVGLSFQQLFEEGVADTCVVEVCTTPGFLTGVSYFPVYPNDNTFTGTGTANPDTTVIDITSAAAGHATVYIRFVFQDLGVTSGSTSYVWDFAWAIDDVCVGGLAAHDVALDRTYLDQPFNGESSGAFSSAMFGFDHGMIPQEFINATPGSLDSIYPISQLTNYSHAAESSVPVTCTLTGPAGAPAYSQTYTYTSLPGDAYDSGFVFPGYWSNTKGTYTFNFNAALTTDADPANNTQSATFQIDDTIWNVNDGPVNLGNAYFLYSASSSISSCSGARFDVSPGVTGDTVSGFGVGFANSATFGLTLSPTGKVCVQLYSNTQGATSWSYVGESYSHTLSAANVSSSSTLVWTDFRTTDGYGPYDNWLILQPNTTYAAIVQISGMTDDLLIYSTPVPDATYFAGPGYFGQSATSSNSGGPDFGSTDQTGTTYVPCVQMYFGNIKPQTEGVHNVTTDNSVGNPFPNPSSYSFTIPITLAQDNQVTVTLMDMMGQVVSTQNINAIGGHTATAVFYTSDLAQGIYLYSVQANGVNTTGRVVVAH